MEIIESNFREMQADIIHDVEIDELDEETGDALILSSAGKILVLKERLTLPDTTLEQKFKECFYVLRCIRNIEGSIMHYMGFQETPHYRGETYMHQICSIAFLSCVIAKSADEHEKTVIVDNEELTRLKIYPKSAITLDKLIVARTLPDGAHVNPYTKPRTKNISEGVDHEFAPFAHEWINPDFL